MGCQQGQTFTTRLYFQPALLFFPGDLAHSVGQFFVDFSPVTDREDPDDMRFAIQFELVVVDLNPSTLAPTVCDANRNI